METALTQQADWQVVEQVDETTSEIKPIAQLYAWERQQSQLHPQTGEQFTWTERVLVVRSLALQAGLKTKREQARQRLYAELDKLTQPAKQGRKRYRHQEELAQEVTTLLNRYHLNGIVTVTLRTEPHKDGGQRWLVAGYQCDEAAWQQMVDQLVKLPP